MTAQFDFDEEIDRMGTDSLKWQDADDDVLAMALADMDFKAAPVILEALASQVDHGVYGYTDGIAAFEAARQWVSRRRAFDIEPGTLLAAPGVMPSIAHLLRGWLEPGTGVIVQTPGFAPIPDVITSNGFRVVENPLRLVNGRYEMDLDGFRAMAADDGVGAFVLCSPHNPSGRIWSRIDLSSIADIALEHDILVISDEIHGEVVHPWADFVTYSAVARDGSPHAICFGPSKAFNLPGMRLSLNVVEHEELRRSFHDELFKVNETFGISAPGAAATASAFSNGDEWIDALTEYLGRNLETLTAGLSNSSPDVEVVRPDASYLVWLDCRRTGMTDSELEQRLSAAGVLIESGLSFGPSGSGFVRINIGTTHRRVATAVDRMAGVFSMV